jgi:hypothetical protein
VRITSLTFQYNNDTLTLWQSVRSPALPRPTIATGAITSEDYAGGLGKLRSRSCPDNSNIIAFACLFAGSQRLGPTTLVEARRVASARYVPFARNKIENGLRHGKAWVIHWLGGVKPAGTYARISEHERIAAGNVARESRDSRYRFDRR